MSQGSESTKLYLADVGVLSEKEYYGLAYSTVSSSRRNKVDRLGVEKDKLRSLGAEVLLLYALKQSGVSGVFEKLKRDENGKPYLSTDELRFNLSHSGNFVLCVVSDKPVGCDIQKKDIINVGIARRFHPQEYKEILSQNTEKERLERFYRFWTLKESYQKALGAGMKLPLDSFKITLGEKISVENPLDKSAYSFREFTLLADYGIAVCVRGESAESQIVAVDLKKALASL